MWTLTLLALAQAGRFFERPAVEFWGTPEKPAAHAWREPGHAVPEPVARLLDAPTDANARAYVRWQEERLARLAAAIEAIERLKADPGGDVLYFTQPGCAYCARQDEELAGVDLGGRTLRRIRPGEAPELWARFAVNATPTLVVDGRPLRGLTRRAELERRVRR